MDTAPAPAPTPGAALTSTDKLLILGCHLSLFVGVAFLLPLIVYLAKKDEGTVVAANAREALNFHISLVIYSVIGLILIFVLIGIPMLIILGIGAAVCSILAAVRGMDGGVYRYPLTLRLV